MMIADGARQPRRRLLRQFHCAYVCPRQQQLLQQRSQSSRRTRRRNPASEWKAESESESERETGDAGSIAHSVAFIVMSASVLLSHSQATLQLYASMQQLSAARVGEPTTTTRRRREREGKQEREEEAVKLLGQTPLTERERACVCEILNERRWLMAK